MSGCAVDSRSVAPVRRIPGRSTPTLAIAGAAPIAMLCWPAVTPTAPPPIGYEVWLSEQADSQNHMSFWTPDGRHIGVHAVSPAHRHGMVLIRNVVSGAPRYLHLFDRIRNNVEVFQVSPPWHDSRPVGGRIFVAWRGPFPLTVAQWWASRGHGT